MDRLVVEIDGVVEANKYSLSKLTSAIRIYSIRVSMGPGKIRSHGNLALTLVPLRIGHFCAY